MQENAGAPSEGGGAAQSDNRPGGGLGPPIDAPDPLQKYRWYIVAGFAAVLAVGGVVIATRQQAANRAGRSMVKGRALLEEDEDFEPAPVSVGRQVRTDVRANARANGSSSDDRRAEVDARPARSSSSMLLEGLKEELFQLEVEHKQGRITQQEYDQAKSALDHTLQRALKRESTKQT